LFNSDEKERLVVKKIVFRLRLLSKSITDLCHDPSSSIGSISSKLGLEVVIITNLNSQSEKHNRKISKISAQKGKEFWTI
jgi:hypothetical protein